MKQWTMERIRRMRIAVGLSQSQFANKYGIPKRTIEDWERGIRKPQQYVINLLGAKVAVDFSVNVEYQESYDYSELLMELKAEVVHGFIKPTDNIQVMYDNEGNIIDWYYDSETMEDMIDELEPEEIKQYNKDLQKLKEVNVMEIIKFMENRQLLIVD